MHPAAKQAGVSRISETFICIQSSPVPETETAKRHDQLRDGSEGGGTYESLNRSSRAPPSLEQLAPYHVLLLVNKEPVT